MFREIAVNETKLGIVKIEIELFEIAEVETFSTLLKLILIEAACRQCESCLFFFPPSNFDIVDIGGTKFPLRCNFIEYSLVVSAPLHGNSMQPSFDSADSILSSDTIWCNDATIVFCRHKRFLIDENFVNFSRGSIFRVFPCSIKFQYWASCSSKL